MGFEKFGKVSFTSETKVGEFVELLEEGKICASKCKNCEKLYFPPRMDCFNCLSSEMEWVELSGRCKLITYTTATFSPTGFEDALPYTQALAEFEEGPKVFAWMSKDIKEEEIKIGMNLKLVPVKIDGKISYEFVKE
ncbi:MAG: Zn-ribbon domain-containing OB-fold protein [Candidatus Syntropharchaeia archaeon]